MNWPSWDWFISVIVVGLALNLVSAYLKVPLDRLFGTMSRAWSTRSGKRQEERAARVAALARRRDAQLDAQFMQLACRLHGIVLFIAAGFFFSLGALSSFAGLTWQFRFLIVAAGVLVLRAMNWTSQATATQQEVQEAQRSARAGSPAPTTASR
jgi:hypothetical protein